MRPSFSRVGRGSMPGSSLVRTTERIARSELRLLVSLPARSPRCSPATPHSAVSRPGRVNRSADCQTAHPGRWKSFSATSRSQTRAPGRPIPLADGIPTTPESSAAQCREGREPRRAMTRSAAAAAGISALAASTRTTISSTCTAPGFLDTSLTISGSFGRRSRKRRTRMPQDRRGGVSPYLG